MVALKASLGSVDGGSDILDEAIHINAGCKEACHITSAISLKFRMIIGMTRDEIDTVIGLFKNRFFPFTKCVHHVTG